MLHLHHVALGAHDVEALANFYRQAFGLLEVARHDDARGGLRSVWLGLARDAVLMIERTAECRAPVHGVGAGPFLLAFSVPANERQNRERLLEALGAAIESRGEYSSYARDPEGNRVALSTYPLAMPTEAPT